MSIKHEAKIWCTPSGEVAPLPTDCNNWRGFGYSIGQLPEETSFDPVTYVSGNRHARWQTRSPQSKRDRNGDFSFQGDGALCNDPRRPVIDFSNTEDNACPSFAMIPATQQFLKSTENLLDTNKWRFKSGGQINTVTDDTDPYNDTPYKVTSTAYTNDNQLSGAFYQKLGYNNNASFLSLQRLSTSVFVKQGTQDMQLGFMMKFSQGSTERYDNYAIFDFQTERITHLADSQYFKTRVNVEKLNNGWYRLEMMQSNSQSLTYYWSLYSLKPGVTPESWKQDHLNNNFNTMLANSGQYYYVAKPNVTTRGRRLSDNEIPNSWFNTSGMQPYIKNTSSTNAVFKLQTGLRQVYGPVSTPPGVRYSYYFDIYVTDDPPQTINALNSGANKNPFWVSFFYSPNQQVPYDYNKGRILVRLNGTFYNGDMSNYVQLEPGRHKLFFQTGEVWIDGVKYDSDKTWQPGDYGLTDQYLYGRTFDIKATQMMWIKNMGIWERQLTDNEILSL